MAKATIEKSAWQAFMNVVNDFLWNIKSEKYMEKVNELRAFFELRGVTWALRFCFYLVTLGNSLKTQVMSVTRRDECFHQDIKVMEECYQGRWDIHMMVDYCWSLKKDVSNLNHPIKSRKPKFLPSWFDFIWLQGLCLFSNAFFSKEKETHIKCPFNFWSLSFPARKTLHCDKVETSFE